MLGERFGSFKAVARIGVGSVGQVFLAEHQRIERRAAIKVLMPEQCRDPETMRRLFVEARATSLIRHPGIVEIYDCDVHRDGHAYLVMEYLEGETLAARLDRLTVLPWPVACHIARQVAEAMGAAHAKGIVHRDLKPHNVFLLAAGERSTGTEVKVLDFGLAQLLTSNVAGEATTATGLVVGSPAYMSPEQCNGDPADHRSDVYSLGCMLFEMIAGVAPFTGSRLRDLLVAHRFKTPPSLSAVAPQASDGLSTLVARMLSKAPHDRPQSMAEVAAALANQR
jgi:serine/threonine protein kinase